MTACKITNYPMLSFRLKDKFRKSGNFLFVIFMHFILSSLNMWTTNGTIGSKTIPSKQNFYTIMSQKYLIFGLNLNISDGKKPTLFRQMRLITW